MTDRTSVKQVLVLANQIPRAAGQALLRSRASSDERWAEWLSEPSFTQPTRAWLDGLLLQRYEVPALGVVIGTWLRMETTGKHWLAEPGRAGVYLRDPETVNGWFIEQNRSGLIEYYVRGGSALLWRPIEVPPFGPVKTSPQRDRMDGLVQRLLAMDPFPANQRQALIALGLGVSKVTQALAYREARRIRSEDAGFGVEHPVTEDE